jgi:hypothetical protein
MTAGAGIGLCCRVGPAGKETPRANGQVPPGRRFL